MKYIKNGVINDGIILETENGTCYNPTHEMYIENGWEEYKEPTVNSPMYTLNHIKSEISRDLKSYYDSTSVSGFYLNGKLTWIPTQERVFFMIHLKSMVDTGLENRLINILGGKLTVTEAIDILNKINAYVVECYSVYLEHLEKIKKMTTSYDLETYDFTTGYPTQLEFNL